MKDKKLILTILTILALVSLLFAGCSGGSSSGSSSSSSYDRDADYVAREFGVSSDRVKDSVGALAGELY